MVNGSWEMEVSPFSKQRRMGMDKQEVFTTAITSIGTMQGGIIVTQTTYRDGNPHTTRQYVYGVDGKCMGYLSPCQGDELPFKGVAQ